MRAWRLAGLLVALLLGVALLVTLREPNAPSATQAPSPTAQESLPRFAVFEPEPGDVVDPASLLFVWETAGPDATYRFVLSEPNGVPVWSAETGDTAMALPESLPLAPGHEYRWSVDAVLADGRRETTGVKAFHTVPAPG